jgi:membrane protein implicated in regulation of membrane protease activity
MAIWGVSFGIAATITGTFILSALEGGFLAEGFFLIVLSWVLLMVLVAKIVNRMKKE